MPYLKFVCNKTAILHLVIIFLVALLYNLTYSVLTDVPIKYQLNGDAEVHVAHWREFSSRENEDIFLNDPMFRLDIRPAGELAIDKVIVRIADFFRIDLLNWSLALSFLSSAFFLSGVYFITAYTLKNPWAGLLIALGSIIPAFSLGGSSWGFTPKGFLPRELALGLSIWLLFLYFYGAKNDSKKHIGLLFAIAGLLANWYPVLFFHFALILGLADVIRSRSLKKIHLFYGIVFLASASFSLWDIVQKSQTASPVDMEILRQRFGYLILNDWHYVLLRYLRRFIIYIILVPLLYYLVQKGGQVKSKKLAPWRALWWSSLAIAVLGLYLESYTSLTRLYLSRASVWFLFASMVILAELLNSWGEGRNRFIKSAGAVFISVIFVGQTMFPTVYRHIRDFRNESADYLQKIAMFEALRKLSKPGEVTFMNPQKAASVRAYAGRGVYVSWKDGNVAVLDGAKSREWSKHFAEADIVFNSGDFELIKKFSRDHGIDYFVYREDELNVNRERAAQYKIFEAKPYVIVKIPTK